MHDTWKEYIFEISYFVLIRDASTLKLLCYRWTQLIINYFSKCNFNNVLQQLFLYDYFVLFLYTYWALGHFKLTYYGLLKGNMMATYLYFKNSFPALALIYIVFQKLLEKIMYEILFSLHKMFVYVSTFYKHEAKLMRRKRLFEINNKS